MKYINQYLGLQKQDKLRTTFEIALTDVAILRSFDPKEGTLQTTASILFKKLIHELKQSNVQPGDFSAYQHAISELTIGLGGVQRIPVAGTPTGPVNNCTEQAPQGDVGRRVKRVARKAA